MSFFVGYVVGNNHLFDFLLMAGSINSKCICLISIRQRVQVPFRLPIWRFLMFTKIWEKITPRRLFAFFVFMTVLAIIGCVSSPVIAGPVLIVYGLLLILLMIICGGKIAEEDHTQIGGPGL